jgi:hypothetical protein
MIIAVVVTDTIVLIMEKQTFLRLQRTEEPLFRYK